MKQTARGAQHLGPLLAAVFMRRHSSDKTVQSRKRIVLAGQLQSVLQSGTLRTKKLKKPPQRRAVECPLINLLSIVPTDVTDAALGRDGPLQ